MIEVAIMLEGQNGLNWERFKRIAAAIEDLGFAGLYRSDHYTNASPPDKDSLELWVSLAWLASHTSRIEFGPLVSPVSFRHPTMTARMASAVDDLSVGRLTLGLGAGWQEREHTNYGWDLLDLPGRFQRFEEGLEVITRLLHSDTPVDFSGEFFSLNEAILLPRPARAGGPPILIGGNGPKRTLPLVAKYADEWNALLITPQDYQQKTERLDRLIQENGRKPADVRRSLMTPCEYGRSKADVRQRVEERTKGKLTVEEFAARGFIVGTGNQMVDQIGRFAELGLQRIMLQWLDLDGVDRLEAMAKEILPQLG